MGTLLQDLRYGLRWLARTPGFTIVAVLSLALGIGANAAIFSLVNTVLFRPLPGITKPKELSSVYLVRQDHTQSLLSYPKYVDFRDRNDVFSGLVAFKFATLSLSHDGNNQRIWGYLVTGNYFDVLGVKPFLGRTFLPEEDRTPGANAVAVLSYSCWQNRFNSDPLILGKSVVINNRSFDVIGIAPQGFNGTEVIFQPEVWVPVMMEETIEPGASWLDKRELGLLFAVGRLKTGVSAARAVGSLNGVARQLGEEHPDVDRGETVLLNPPGLLVPRLRGSAIGMAGFLMVVVGLVLLLACVNIATLLLARAADRRKEIAIRLALGASRKRLIRQLLTEGLLLSIAGGILGFFFALWINHLVVTFKPPVDFPIFIDLRMDWRVLSFSLFVSLLTGVLFGLAPALQATKTEVVPTLKDDSGIGGYRRSRLRNLLVVAQMAISFVLLIGAGLILKSLQHVQGMNPGFEPDHAVEASFDLGIQGYDAERSKVFYREIKDRVATLPGVQSVGLANYLPLSLNRYHRGVFIEGQAVARGTQLPSVLTSHVGPDYFRTLATPLLSGEEFTTFDADQKKKVAIINESFAHRFWPAANSLQEVIGKRFSFGGAEGVFWEVVGVVKDGKYVSLSESPQPFVYTPLEDEDMALTLVARSASDSHGTLLAIANEVKRLDPNLPVYDAKTLDEHLSLSLFPTRVAAGALISFGLLALGLAALGLYGMMSYSVAQRTQEIGIRMALGAEVADLLKLILKQGLLLAFVGMSIGLLGALALSRVMSGLLSGITTGDPLIFLGILVLLGLVALIACVIPARRVTRIEPIIALRYN